MQGVLKLQKIRPTGQKHSHMSTCLKCVSTHNQTVGIKPVILSVGPTTLELPLQISQLKDISQVFNNLVKTFQEKSEAKRPKRYDSAEYRYQGTDDDEMQYLEVFCNPNAYQTLFDAKVLVTIKTKGGISLATEMMFSSVKQSMDSTLSQLQ
eukprot:TRINITY_DN17234_c2_g1_i1.p1 TRINITY_DN17234_c2_g1~~TRINITY_DN17234_c2_g1_i1.p1  ORF type:complete len:152 (-),score=4.53 TRINITY_DN17234_c2_g1_i1:124-579(-)